MNAGRFRRLVGVVRRQWLVILQAVVIVSAAAAWQASRTPEGATTAPSGRDVAIRAVLGAVLGLFIGGVLAAVREMLDDRLKSPDEAVDLLDATVIARLPKSAKELRSTSPVIDDSERILLEGFRTLRTSVRFLGSDEPVRAVAVTSPEQGDGKSVVSSNLAAAFARSGLTTVLVSGDLRRPKLDAAFGVAGSLGLMDLLAEPQPPSTSVEGGRSGDAPHPAVSAGDLLCETGIERLWILPAGLPTGDPADLLASPRLATVIEDVVKFADVVIIDCPPTAVTDGIILSKLVDGALVVCAMGKTHRSSVQVAADRLAAARVRILGVVANRAEPEHADSYAYGYFGRPEDR